MTEHLDKTDLEGIRTLLMREIAIQLLSNRVCANNIAALYELHKLHAKAGKQRRRFKLEFDIDASDSSESKPSTTRADAFAEEEAGTPDTPVDAGTPSSGDTGVPGEPVSRGDGGIPATHTAFDAGTTTPVQVTDTIEGGIEVKVNIGV
jgi:hypothetical protein